MDKIRLTMLNFMADTDFEKSLIQQSKWGIKALDIKNRIFGKELIDLTDDEANRAAELIKKYNMYVYCFSSVLFFAKVEIGEEEFRKVSLDKLDRLLEIAKIIKPKVIRLLCARAQKRQEYKNIISYLKENTPWLFDLYRDAIDKIRAAGFEATIENETGNSIFSSPDEILDFFKELNYNEKVTFTYDIQNLWELGRFPTAEDYKKLAKITSYLHLKGGRSEIGTDELVCKSSLEEASWPVKDIVSLAIKDNAIKYFCLNPPHGKKAPEEFNIKENTQKDIEFLRNNFKEVE